jgi:hypothetical protein
MSKRRMVGVLCGALALVFTSGAAAKNFAPGDLRLCGARHCVAIANQRVLPQLSRFYYCLGSPARMFPPRMGAPYFQLKFRNDYVTGILATRHFDRFLSYGVHLERFKRGVWYRVPARIALELRRLSTALEPFRLSPAAVAKSR